MPETKIKTASKTDDGRWLCPRCSDTFKLVDLRANSFLYDRDLKKAAEDHANNHPDLGSECQRCGRVYTGRLADYSVDGWQAPTNTSVMAKAMDDYEET